MLSGTSRGLMRSLSSLSSRCFHNLAARPLARSLASPSSQTQPYLSVHIRCHKHVVDMLSEALLSFGASSVSIDEQDDDHESSDEESFNPVKLTEGLWIVPEWRVPPDVQATNIILNPGLAFGTGEHPTTKLCLLLLHRSINGGERVLDYGTGSGVLAIAALKLGCFLSVGIDIEPQAIESAGHNAELNEIGCDKLKLRLVTGETGNEGEVNPEAKQFDVIIANILLNPLLDLADNIVSYGKPGAIIGLSGILSEQVPYILERYSSLLEGMSVTEMDDWACVCGTKRPILSDN